MSSTPTCVISGGSRGVGQALVQSFLDSGYIVATFSRSRSAFVEQCTAQYGERFVWREVDARNPAALKSFVRDFAVRHKRIDVLVNNAGTAVEGVLTLTSDDDIKLALESNLEAAFHLTAACVKAMLRQGSGSIINVSSVNAIRGHSGVAVYSATKAALDGFSRSLAREVGPRGIRVNSIAPGYLETEMTRGMPPERKAQIIRRTPLGRLGKVEDIIGAVRFLVSDEARFITGQTLVIDGGLTC